MTTLRTLLSPALLLPGLLALWTPPAHAQDDAQVHILNAGINLGWAAGIVESDGGVTAANRAEIGEDLTRAREHVAALRAMVSSPPYETSALANVERQIDRLAPRIGGMRQGEATRELYQLRSNLREALRVFLSARTSRLQRSTTCDSAIVDVGFYFGQGHTSAQRGNAQGERRARDYLRRAIATGEAAARRLACPFDGAGYRGLPMMSDPSGQGYGRSLPVVQRTTRQASRGRARAGATARTSPPPRRTPPRGRGRSPGGSGRGGASSSSGRPDLSCAWSSSHGTIRWSEGYYGNRTKTIRGSLRREGGRWVYRGTWGRTNSSRSGTVVFTFSSARTFEGYWTEGSSNTQHRWTGSSSCH